MSNFHAVYYRDADGREPVREFIESFDAATQAAIDTQIDRLNMLNDRLPHLPFPHTSQVDGELRELRCHYGRNLYRILYRRSGRLLVLLHIFAKRSAKIPDEEIAVARQRWRDFKKRMDARPRVPPRAAGRDAPLRFGRMG
jgi:phage-related protein